MANDPKLIETTVLKNAVRMRFADEADSAKAIEWLEFQVPASTLATMENRPQPLGDLQVRLLAEVQLAALHRVRGVVGEEIQRLSALIGRIRQ